MEKHFEKKLSILSIRD